jgi:hypothetical protein
MPTQDQSLINNLIQQQNSSAYAQQMASEIESTAADNHLQVARVVTAKYKIYVIILLILSVTIGVNYAPQVRSQFQSVQEQFSQKQEKI